MALLAEDVSKDLRRWVAFILGNLVLDVENKIIPFSHVIRRLVVLFSEDISKGTKSRVAKTLRVLALEVDNGDYEVSLQNYEDNLVEIDGTNHCLSG